MGKMSLIVSKAKAAKTLEEQGDFESAAKLKEEAKNLLMNVNPIREAYAQVSNKDDAEIENLLNSIYEPKTTVMLSGDKELNDLINKAFQDVAAEKKSDNEVDQLLDRVCGKKI